MAEDGGKAHKDGAKAQKDRNKLLERGSILFGRPSAKTGKDGKPKPVKPPISSNCFEACFAGLMGHPGVSDSSAASSVHYGAPTPLGKLPPYSTWDDLLPEHKGGVKVQVASTAKENVPGWINQDSTVVCCPVASQEGLAPLLFGVFDGHGKHGHVVSKLVAERLPGRLVEQDNVMKNPKQALTVAVKAVDQDIYTNLGPDVEYSGTTGVIALFDPNSRTLTMANVGDSRAVLGQMHAGQVANDAKALPLTTDCKPDMPEERERIELQGGVVQRLEEDGQFVGPSRVWDSMALVKPGLATSRTIGDGCARACGVCADPVVTTHRLQTEDRFLLLASDGIWDTIKNDEAAKMCAKFLHLPQVGLKALIEAVRRREDEELPDDTTVIMVVF